MLSVGEIGVSLVRFSSSDVPVTQEVVLAHGTAVDHGGYDESFVKRKKSQLLGFSGLGSGKMEGKGTEGTVDRQNLWTANRVLYFSG